MRHFLSIRELDREMVTHLFRLTADLKAKQKARDRSVPLAGRAMAMIFEKPSLRTRVTFEVGMTDLGGSAVYLAAQEIGMGKRESVADIARNLSRWVDLITARVFAHATVEELARHATVPVINGLSDLEHPCQALADLFTLWERGVDLGKTRLAWIGDGNNVCNSFIEAARAFDFKLAIACPEGYEPATALLSGAGDRIRLLRDPLEAADGAHLVVTDVWASMGQEDEQARRVQAFADYQVNAALMKRARRDALFMHCLPAHRGEEVTAEVIDGEQSAVWAEAGNRLHAQKALLEFLLSPRRATARARARRRTHH